MDMSMIEATQALEFDYDEEPIDENETVAYLNVPCQKGFPGKLYPITEGDNVIGRGDHCKICIPLKGLSREHACIEVKGGNPFIYDKGSRNKTRRNNFFLATSVRYELKDQDNLIFGDVNCVYQVGTEGPVADDDETGSETGSESMFETAQMTDSLTIMETPAPPSRARKGFADEFTIPESESEAEDENQKTVVSTLVADSQDGDDMADKLMGAPTQAFVCDSDATTDEDSPKKKSILLAATQGYELETESDDDTPNTNSLLTAATQAYVPDSDESPPKKAKPKQAVIEPTMKYTLAEGIDPTLGYDMDEGEGKASNIQHNTNQDKEGEDTARLMCEATQAFNDNEGKDSENNEETQSFHGNVAEDAERTRLLCEATQAFHGNSEDDDDTEAEEEASANSKLMTEPTQAFLGGKDEDKGGNQSESSEEFILEGDTDNEEDSADVRNMFAAPTLACDADGAESEDDGNDGNTVNHDDATQAIAGDATAKVTEDDQTVAVAEGSDDKESSDTQVVNEDVTQVIVDGTVKVTEDDQTVAIADETVGVLDEPTVKVTEDQTVGMVGDTVAVLDEPTMMVSDVDQTVAVEGDNVAVLDEPTMKVTDEGSDDAVAIFDEPTMKVTEEDLTVEGDNVGDLDEATMKVTEDDQTVGIEDDTSTVAVTDDTCAILDEPTVKVTENNQTAPIASIHDEATVKVTEEDQTVDLGGDTIAVSETAHVDEEAEIIPNEENDAIPDNTAQGKEDIPETVNAPGTVPVSNVTVIETLPVENPESEETESHKVDEMASVSNEGDKSHSENTLLVTDDQTHVGNGKKRGRRKAVEKKNNQKTENTTKDEEVMNQATVSEVKNECNEGRGKRGKPNKQTSKFNQESNDSETESKEPEQSENPGPATLGRGKRGKVVKDYNAIVNTGKRKSIKTTDPGVIESASNEDTEENKDINAAKKIKNRNSRSRSKKSKDTVSQELASETAANANNKKGANPSSTVGETTQGQRNRKATEPVNIVDVEPATKACIDENLEPATQAYMDTSPRKGQSSEEQTQQYEEEDSTPTLSEIGLDEETDPLILPEPPVVALPDKSPLKSALVSPEKKKTPSPKRVKFVSQNSEAGSESSQTGGRSRRSKQALDLKVTENQAQENKKGKGKGKSKAKQDKSVIQPVETSTSKAEEQTDKSKIGAAGLGEQTTSKGNVDLPAEETNDSKSSRACSRSKRVVKVEADETTDNVNVPRTNKRSVRGKPIDVEEHKDSDGEKDGVDDRADSTTNRRKGRGKKSIVNETGDSNKGASISDKTAGTSEETRINPSKSQTKQTEAMEENISKGNLSESEVKRPTRGKVKQIEDNNEEDKKAGNKRNSRAKTKVNDDTESDASQQSSQNSIKGSRNKRKTWSQTSDKTAKAIDEITNVKPTARGRRTTHGVNVEKEEKSETVVEPTRSKRGKLKQIEEKSLSVTEEIKQTTRGRRTKIGVSDTDKEERVETETNKAKEAVSQEPAKGIKRKNNQSLDRQSKNVAASETVKASTSTDSETGDKETNTKAEIKPSSRRGRSKQTNSEEHLEVKKEVDEADIQTKKDVKSNASTNRRAAKRKGTEDISTDSNDLVKEDTPAKKQKLKETQSTPRSSTKLDVTTPKNTFKKDTSLDTPKGKQLDTTITGSPTLRKTTTHGVKPKVIFTGVTDEQGEKIVKDLGGELPSSVMECTHLVTDQIRRTVKFLCCVARGIPIVSPQWLVSSKKSGFFSDTTPHIIRDDASEKKFKCNLQRSINKASETPLLTGYKIHVTKSVKPGPDQMKDILKCAGAQYSATMPKAGSPTTLVISCDEDKSVCEGALRQGITVVNAEFVLTGILRQEVDINSIKYSLFADAQDKSSSQEPPNKKRKR